jgi:hypothetical protein
MDRTPLIPLLVFSLLGAVFLARKLAERDPDRPWAIVLFRIWFGPRTDVANLTKAQLFESGLRFMTWGFIFMSVFFSIGILAKFLYPGTDWPASFLGLWFFCALITGMGFLGGAYLLVRAAFRPHKWTPPTP